LFAGASVSIVPDANQADGIQQLTAADAATGSTATITLTGLTPAQDAGVFNTASFNTIFGAGSLA
jgi:predicted aconitase